MKHTEMIAVIHAHSEGKAIQGKSKFKEKWLDTNSQSLNFVDYDYRVKPVPVYKTFMAGTDLVSLHNCGKYVEIKALEDAMYIINMMNCSPERPSDNFDNYAPLKDLIS